MPWMHQGQKLLPVILQYHSVKLIYSIHSLFFFICIHSFLLLLIYSHSPSSSFISSYLPSFSSICNIRLFSLFFIDILHSFSFAFSLLHLFSFLFIHLHLHGVISRIYISPGSPNCNSNKVDYVQYCIMHVTFHWSESEALEDRRSYLYVLVLA